MVRRMALFSSAKLRMPTTDRGPPRPHAAHARSEAHFVSGAASCRRFRGHAASRSSGSAASGAPSGKFWQVPGVYATAVGYSGGLTPNPTYEEVCSGRTGHTEAVLVVYDPKVVSYDELLRVFWESHDPTQGMRQGNDVGTQYRSAIYWYDDEQRRAAEASRDALPGRRSTAAGYGAITTEIAAARRVLLRRGLPPAVPREESGRILRARRHRASAAPPGSRRPARSA